MEIIFNFHLYLFQFILNQEIIRNQVSTEQFCKQNFNQEIAFNSYFSRKNQTFKVGALKTILLKRGARLQARIYRLNKSNMKISQDQLKQRIQEILASIKQKQKLKESVVKLSDIGKEYGFGEDNNIRLQAYQVLLEISDEEISMPFANDNKNGQGKEDNFKSILRDCSSSFKLLDACMDQQEEQMQSLRNQLVSMMTKLFREYDQYHYYRGYENFCNALQVEIEKSVSIQVNNIFKIINQEDQQIAQIFSVTHFLAFCVGWVLTWFAFNIRKNKDILRIYDFLISSPPENVVILGAAFILGTKDIMKEHIQESQDGGEIGVLYGIYQNIWQVDYDLDHIIKVALELNKKRVFTPSMRAEYSPESIIHEKVHTKYIPVRKCLFRKDYSYLKTSIYSLVIIIILAYLAQLYLNN